jgi:hydrogenase maturation protein HypF
LIRGLVQGVGFRPFICRLAASHGLSGTVENRTDGVSVVLQADLKTVDLFSNELLGSAPPASRIKAIQVNPRLIEGFSGFSIIESRDRDEQITEVSPDIAVCGDCLDDLENDPERKDYPLINCTNCGPRFTIVRSIPYDRVNTTMSSFAMCVRCSADYNDILDRRFHAQPVACNKCGPQYFYHDGVVRISDIHKILVKVAKQIASGGSVAIKGTGGYHIMCNALDKDAVMELRSRKQRDSKPFAVMFRDISAIHGFCHVSQTEERELLSWRRPIVILDRKKPFSESVSSGLNTIGALLPYMPVHYMLFKALDTPAVVLTSGNLADDPVIIGDELAKEKLMPVTNSLVSYNREILNRTDDSVVRVIDKKLSIIRRSRGFVPQPVNLICNVDGIMATGAEQKNTFCIGKGAQAVMSQHIGDLKNFSTYNFFTSAVERFKELFRFIPAYVACDLHPDYLSTIYAGQLAEERNIVLLKVQHHHAHIASCMAEYGLNEKVIGISLDGTGYGTDGNTWGGEFLIADLQSFERYSHFDYIPMPGGDRAVEKPWRMAFSVLYRYFGDTLDYKSIPLFRSIDDEKIGMVRQMLIQNINSPLSSGAGRLFDAVAALTGVCPEPTYDSEPPMRLESVISEKTNLYYPFSAGDTISFADTFSEILNDIHKTNAPMISAKFHNTLSHIILDLSKRIRKETSLKKVVLSGGVFQNKYLLERSFSMLRKSGFKVYTNHLVPANDGGIALGQIIIASKTLGLCV